MEMDALFILFFLGGIERMREQGETSSYMIPR